MELVVVYQARFARLLNHANAIDVNPIDYIGVVAVVPLVCGFAIPMC